MWIAASEICQIKWKNGYVEFNTYFTDKNKIKETTKSFFTKPQMVLYCLQGKIVSE